VLEQFAAKLLRQGCVFACAWGRDCEKVHDAIDYAAIEADALAGSDDVVLTTWHTDESLDETLYFAVFSAWAAASYESTTQAVVAIVEPSLRAIVESRLSDTTALASDVLGSEGGEAP